MVLNSNNEQQLQFSEEGSNGKPVKNSKGDQATNGADHTLRQEMWNIVLLVLLYCMQGVPMGLSVGSM